MDRFICKEDSQNNLNQAKIKSLFYKNVKQKMKKMPRYLFSEKIHSKSIYFLNEFFKGECPLSKHFTMSYQNNYDLDKLLDYIGTFKTLHSLVLFFQN